MGLTKVNHPDLLDLASDTGATVFPKGTTAERPVSPEAGYIRFNTTDNVMETYDGTEWLVLDTLTPSYAVDCLVVAGGAGGGGGSGYLGGGGGSGGLLYYGSETPKTPNGAFVSFLTGTTYTITVGGGGAGNLTSAGQNGSNSILASFTAIGGGGGSSLNGLSANAAQNGGSGGGTFNSSGAGVGTSGQGFNGGTGYGAGADYGAGGGGGAGAAGINAAVGSAPLGGLELTYLITGSSI